MDEFKTYKSTNMKVTFEYPASWTAQQVATNSSPAFDQAMVSSPHVDNDIDKGAVIGLSLLPDPLPGTETPDPDAEEMEKEMKQWMKERPCKLGNLDATCLEGTNPLGAKIFNYIVKRNGKRFGLHLSVMPAELWPSYQAAFDKVIASFRFTEGF